jgi:quercetin dioxygenase-like cupin family protein/type 1 glutamine amidotransferase
MEDAMRPLRWLVWAIAAAFALAAPVLAQPRQPIIVLIGGERHGTDQGQDDFPNGILKLERILRASSNVTRLHPAIRAYPAGFPSDPSEIDDASVVVLYLDPSAKDHEGKPVLSPAVRAQLDKLMARGVGLVALHQSVAASTAEQASAIRGWFGASYRADGDRSIEVAPIKIVAKAHPTANGVGDFDQLDEYRSPVDLAGQGATPVLSANAHVQFRGQTPLYEGARQGVSAWAYERPGGGRSFGFAGGHFLTFLDQPQLRRLLLNAILWVGGNEVPAEGAGSSLPTSPQLGVAPPPEPQLVVLRGHTVKLEKTPWGQLEWFAHRSLGNSSNVTLGRATILPAQANPPHWHPNCDEVLYVLQGHIMHRVGDKEYEMRAGDTVVIPEGTIHNARNIGDQPAVLMVAFNSADRVAVGE